MSTADTAETSMPDGGVTVPNVPTTAPGFETESVVPTNNSPISPSNGVRTQTNVARNADRFVMNKVEKAWVLT